MCTTRRFGWNLFDSAADQRKRLISSIREQLIKRRKLKVNESSRYRPTSRGENGQGSSSANQLLLPWKSSPAEFLLESGGHDISRTHVSLVFR